MTPTPERTRPVAFLTAYAAALSMLPIRVDTDAYVRGVEDAQDRMRRFARHAAHFSGAWRGDGVQPRETRQMRRARERKAVAR